MTLLGVIALGTVVITAFTVGVEVGWFPGENWGRKMAQLEALQHKRD